MLELKQTFRGSAIGEKDGGETVKATVVTRSRRTGCWGVGGDTVGTLDQPFVWPLSTATIKSRGRLSA